MAESQTSEIWRVQLLDVLYMRAADVGGRQAGCRAEPARASPGCRAGVDRFTNYRPKLGRRPPLYRPGFARFPLVYWPAPGDFWSLVFEGHRPSPVQMWQGTFQANNPVTFGRSTISAGDRWICDVGMTLRTVTNVNFSGFDIFAYFERICSNLPTVKISSRNLA